MLPYIIRTTLFLTFFYAFYMLVMRRTTFFRFNRIMIFAGTVLCFLLPLVHVPETAVPSLSGGLDSVMVLPEASVSAAGTASTPTAGFPWPALILGLYLAGAAVVAGMTVLSLLSIRKKIRSGECIEEDGYHIVLSDANHSAGSFSWGRYILMSRTDYEQNPVILLHEKVHVRCRHSWDVAAFSLVTILHWFNPIVWMMRLELALLHEYEADEGVLDQGVEPKQYQLLLVRKSVGEERFSLANGFNHAKLSGRISMMQSLPSRAVRKAVYAAILPVFLVVAVACNSRSARNEQRFDNVTVQVRSDKGLSSSLVHFSLKDLDKALDKARKEASDPAYVTVTLSQEEGAEQEYMDVLKYLQEASVPFKQEIRNASVIEAESGKTAEPADSDGAIPFTLVEQKPSFNGGDPGEFSKWVNEHLHYPDEAKNLNVSGRVLVNFTVDKDGSVKNVKILRGVHPLLDEVVVKVVSESPAWTPGKVRGEPVPVTFSFPVVFRLK